MNELYCPKCGLKLKQTGILTDPPHWYHIFYECSKHHGQYGYIISDDIKQGTIDSYDKVVEEIRLYEGEDVVERT